MIDLCGEDAPARVKEKINSSTVKRTFMLAESSIVGDDLMNYIGLKVWILSGSSGRYGSCRSSPDDVYGVTCSIPKLEGYDGWYLATYLDVGLQIAQNLPFRFPPKPFSSHHPPQIDPYNPPQHPSFFINNTLPKAAKIRHVRLGTNACAGIRLEGKTCHQRPQS